MGDSVFGLTPGEIIWYQHHARGHQYEKHRSTYEIFRLMPSSCHSKHKQPAWQLSLSPFFDEYRPKYGTNTRREIPAAFTFDIGGSAERVTFSVELSK